MNLRMLDDKSYAISTITKQRMCVPIFISPEAMKRSVSLVDFTGKEPF